MAVFTNYATLTYAGGTANSNTIIGELRETLTAAKTAVSPDYTAGDTVTYTLSLLNSGTTPLTVTSVTDNLGGYLYNGTTVYPLTYRTGSMNYFINGVLQAVPTLVPGPPLVVSGLTIPAGGNAILVYETTVNLNAPLSAGSVVMNDATIVAEGLAAPLTVEAEIPAAATANLSISKSLSPAVVTENGQVTYTFVIENTGNTPADAAGNVSLSDTFNPILTGITVTYNGGAWTEGVNYNYNDTTGIFSTVPGQITVPAATYMQNPDGSYTVNPGLATVSVTGTI